MTRRAFVQYGALIGLLVGTIVLGGCSLDVERPSGSGSIRINLEERQTEAHYLANLLSLDGPVKIQTPTAVSDFNCFAVNVTGTGIPSLSTELEGCETFGRMSTTGVGVLTDIFPRGSAIEIVVPAGTKRLIDVYGVYPDECTGSSSGTSGEGAGEGYFLGGVLRDITADTAVTVPIAFSAGTSPSVRCYGGNHGGDSFHISMVFPYGGVDSGGWTMNVNGGGFSTGATVTVDGANCPVTARTSNQITCTVPSGSQGSNKQVVVTNGPGQTATFDFFAYVSTGDPFVSVDKNTNDINLGSVPVASGSSSLTVTFANMGGVSAVASDSISGTHSSDFTFGANGCPTSAGSLAAGSSCSVTIHFDPGGAGARTATLSYFGLNMTLNGTGI